MGGVDTESKNKSPCPLNESFTRDGYAMVTHVEGNVLRTFDKDPYLREAVGCKVDPVFILTAGIGCVLYVVF